MVLFYIILFVVIAIFFGALLIYGTQEKSFEQALEEQRSKNSFDLLLTNTTGKSENTKKETKKEKVKKVKDAGAKKSKEKSAVNQVNKSVSSKDQNGAKITVPKEVEPVSAKLQPAAPQPDVVDQAPPETSVVVKQAPVPVKEAPKKALQPKAKQSAPEKNVTEKVSPVVVVKAAEVKTTDVKAAPAKITESIQNSSEVTAPGLDVKTSQQEQPKVNNKKSKRSISKASKELSFDDILELVNSSYFSDDDITRLTDALLNRQADEQKNDFYWHKKNDPVEALQKQLAEKKELIDQQNKNMEAVKKQSASVINEYQTFKKRFNKLESDNENLHRELGNQKSNYGSMIRDVEVKHQQKLEQKVNEIKSEERNRYVSEINRLTDIINGQNEGIKNKEHGIEELAELNQQFKNEKAELIEKIAELNALYEESRNQLSNSDQSRKRETEILQDQIKKLTANVDLLESKVQESEASTVDVDAYTSQIQSLKTDVGQYVSENEELGKEIASVKSQNASISLEKENISKDLNRLKGELGELQKEKSTLLAKLESVTSENNSLTSKSDDLNNLIKTNDEKLETLASVCTKLGISSESDNLQKNIDELKTKLSQFDQLSAKYSDLNELLDQANSENETIKSQFDALKQQNKEEVKKSQEFASALLETEKILNDLQEKIIKNKSEQNQKLAEFEQVLTEKTDENENIKDEISKYKENADNLSKLNDNLNVQLKDLKELVADKEGQIGGFKSKEQDLRESLGKIQEENKNLNNKIVKLNNMVQIGKHSFQDECEKVQNLESIISLMNGKENSNMPTSNGNSNNLPQV